MERTIRSSILVISLTLMRASWLACAQAVQSLYSPVIFVRERTYDRKPPDQRPIQMHEDGSGFARFDSAGMDLSNTGGAGGRFMLGLQAGVTVAHVDDIADGHMLAMDKGRSGESYILAGPALTYKQMMEMWQTICGIPAPRLWLPGWTASLSSQLVGGLEKVFRLKTAFSSEVLATQADYTYYATADKARRELGWQPPAGADLQRSAR